MVIQGINEEIKKKREAILNSIKNNSHYTEHEKLKMVSSMLNSWKKEDEKKKTKVQN